MAFYDLGNGCGFYHPPYTDEENDAFEQRLRRGNGITVIHRRKQGSGVSETGQSSIQPSASES